MISTNITGKQREISISIRGYAKMFERQLDSGRVDEKKARVDSYDAIAELKERKNNVAARADTSLRGITSGFEESRVDSNSCDGKTVGRHARSPLSLI